MYFLDTRIFSSSLIIVSLTRLLFFCYVDTVLYTSNGLVVNAYNLTYDALNRSTSQIVASPNSSISLGGAWQPTCLSAVCSVSIEISLFDVLDVDDLHISPVSAILQETFDDEVDFYVVFPGIPPIPLYFTHLFIIFSAETVGSMEYMVILNSSGLYNVMHI